ncbi:MAG: PAS domain S-box protein [bacterium]|jgi:PAS domain S-box-containing protein|nr:PAS domain S-box protein [candidate division KSB1 bacterium]MDH7558982.1 PAS domain S-box protein [bacterium]
MAKRARILVVEDVAITAMDIKRRLQGLGYEVVGVAASGEDAIAKAENERPDLVLMDIKLKGEMDGVQAAEEVRRRMDIPVVYLTAYSDETTLQRAKVTQPFGYVLKPFEERELHTAVEMALYRHTLERRLRESEQWLATTLRSIGDAVVATDAAGRIVFMNPVAEALVGCTQEEALGKAWNEILTILDEETHDPVSDPVAAVLKDGKPLTLLRTVLVNRRDGRQIPIDDTAAPIRDDSGRILGVVLVFQDVTARREAEERIKQQRTYLQALIENSPLAVVAVDLEGKVTTVNPAFERLFQYQRDEIIGQPLDTFVAAEDKSGEALALTQQVMAGDRVHVVTVRHRRDGSPVDVEIFGVPVMIRGERIGAFGIYQDITERKRAQRALAESEEKYRTLQANVPVGIFRAAPDRRATLRSANPALARLLGYEDPEELLRIGLAALILDKKEAAACRRQLLKQGKVDGLELRLARKDGSCFWAKLSATCIRDHSGAPLYYDGMVEDISEQKRIQEEREERLRRADVINRLTMQLIRSSDVAGIYRQICDAAREMLRCRRAAIGEFTSDRKGLAKLVVSSEEEAEASAWAQEVLCYDDKAYAPLRQGARRAVRVGEGKRQLLAAALLGPGGSVYGLLVVGEPQQERLLGQEDESDLALLADYATVAVSRAMNLAALRKARKELSLRAQALARSNADLEQFAYVASHDLQEPLRMVSSYCQLLAQRYKDKLDAEAQQFVQFAVDGARRMQVLINDLLQYSRVSTRGKPFEPVDLGAVLEDAKANLRFAIEESGAVITNDPLPTVSVDRTQMTQVLQNLLSNAIKFRNAKTPRIHVGVASDKKNWEISVRDNGIGFEQKFADRIFGVFQRLHTREQYPGTGIGLAVVKKIVERHGGRIRAESEPGKGSCFTFTLPANNGREEQA